MIKKEGKGVKINFKIPIATFIHSRHKGKVETIMYVCNEENDEGAKKLKTNEEKWMT